MTRDRVARTCCGTAGRARRRATVAGALVGLLGLGLLPATATASTGASPDSGGPEDAFVRSVLAELTAVSARSRERALTTGAAIRTDLVVPDHAHSYAASSRQRVLVAPGRGDLSVTQSPPPWRSGALRELSYAIDPCATGPQAGVGRVVHREGLGRYSRLRPLSDEMRQGRALVDRPRARWAFERKPFARLDAVLRRNDPLRAVVTSLRDRRHVRTVSASKGATAAGGTRYSVTFTTRYSVPVPVPGAGADLERVVVNVGSDGSVTSIRGAHVDRSAPSTVRIRANYRYGPQDVHRPRRDRTAPRRLLVGGCRAVQTRTAVRTTAEAVADIANQRDARKSADVTVGRIRRVAARLTGGPSRLRIRARDVVGGVEVVGRHRSLDAPVRRRVAVVDGRARVLPRR